jgi:hypothetical protein
MTRIELEDVQHACHLAALDAIDKAISEFVGQQGYWIKDGDLPLLLPALNRAIEAALRRAGKTVEEET